MIQWVTKRRLNESDIISISIRVYSDGMIDIGFYGDAHRKITPHDYIMYGVDFINNRIYFQGGTSVNGYKLRYMGKSTHIRSKTHLSAKLSQIVGIYDLLYDEDQELYYIQLGE